MKNNWNLLKKLNDLPNVIVRPSAIKYNDPPPKILGFSKGSTVLSDKNQLKNGIICPKSLYHNSCSDNNCRACWNNDEEINYLVHGFLGQSKIANAFTDNIIKTRTRISTPFIKLTINNK